MPTDYAAEAVRRLAKRAKDGAQARRLAIAAVLSVDEKSQIQALDRTQPGLPMKPGRAGTMPHDYKRHEKSLASPVIMGDVPALHNEAAWTALGRLVIEPEPVPPDEIAFHRHRPLLVLGGELQAADLALDAVEDLFALPLRMQDLAPASGKEACGGRWG